MGVHELWKLLAVAGRDIDPQSLKGTRVAIDVSIWMIRILHGMAKAGLEYQHVHLISIMKRIMHLLILGVKPVFVFDGPAPELKRQTLIKRHQQRSLMNRNLQKVVERYIVKLMERGIQVQENTTVEEDESEKLEFKDVDLKDELPEEEQQVLLQSEHEILNLQYSSLDGNDESFYDLDIETKREIMEEMIEKKGQGYKEDPALQWKRFLMMAELRENIRKIKRLAKQEIEQIRIDKILQDKNDPDNKLIMEYVRENPDIAMQFGTTGENIFLYLKDLEKRQQLLKHIKQTRFKKKRKQRMKDYQVENQYMQKMRDVIRRQYNQKPDDSSSIYDQQDDQSSHHENLMEKYEIFDLDQLADRLDAESPPERVFSKSCDKVQLERPVQQQQEPFYSQYEIPKKPELPTIQEEKEPEVQVDPSQSEESEAQQSQSRSQSEIEITESKPLVKVLDFQSVPNQNNGKQLLDKQQSNESIDSFIEEQQVISQSRTPIRVQELDEIQFIPQGPPSKPASIRKMDTFKMSQQLGEKLSSRKEELIQSESKLTPHQQAEKIDDILNQIENQQEEPELSTHEMLQQIRANQNMLSLDFGSLQSKFEEIRELLVLFGIPWVMAPGEAEAQCAFLQAHNLVDCVITDDSDTFLFGATKVLKGLFEKPIRLEYYDAKYIKEDLGLSQEQLIYLALFLGSDYTTGIKGVGIVNAMEIVEAFDNIDALKRFAEWASKPDLLLQNVGQHYENIPEKERIYKEQHKNYKKYWELPPNFPSVEVIEAYLKPTVDDSLEEFQWGTPAVEELAKFAYNVLNYTEQKVEEQIRIPLQNLLKPQQPRITDFFRVTNKIAVVRSRRINNAVANLNLTDPSRQAIQPKSTRQTFDQLQKKEQRKSRKKQKEPKIPREFQNYPNDELIDEADLEAFRFQKRQKK